MLVYTITANIDQSVAEDWMIWVRENFIPSIMDTLLFEKYHMFRVLNDTDGDTITFQFFCKDVVMLQHFQQHYRNDILISLSSAFPDKVVYFSTLLEQLDA